MPHPGTMSVLNRMSTGEYMTKLIDAYNNAPRIGTAAGLAAGIPSALLLGLIAYGGLGLIPGLKKHKRLRTIAGTAAGLYGGSYAYDMVKDPARDKYFTHKTGLPTPWKTYTNPAGQQGKPAEVIDQLLEEWRQLRRPIKDQLNDAIEKTKESLEDAKTIGDVIGEQVKGNAEG